MAAIEGIRAQILANASILFPPRRHRRRHHRHHRQQDGSGAPAPAHVVTLTRAGDDGFFATLVANPESPTPRALAQGPALKDVDYALHGLMFLTAMLLERTARTPMMDGRRSAEIMLSASQHAYVDVVALEPGIEGEGERVAKNKKKKKAETSVDGEKAAEGVDEEGEDDDSGEEAETEDEEATKETEKEFWERVRKEKREIMAKLEEGWAKINI